MTDAASLAQRGVLVVMNTLGRGGGDRVAILLANGFADAGIPTRIVLMTDPDRSEAEIKSLFRDVSVVSAGPAMGIKFSERRPAFGHQQFERFRGVKFLRRQIDGFRPAVVLGASDNLGLILALARRQTDCGIVFALKLTNRLFRPNSGRARRLFRHAMFKFIFDRLDLVLTLTDADRSDALANYPAASFETVANPYVTNEMLDRRPSRTPGAPRLLAAGRMVSQKRFDVLLRAFALSGHVDANLTILGDGPVRPALERLALSLGIADRVDMPGFVGDTVAWLSRADLFLLSSDYEGLPAVLIEALACNVPVVTTDSFLAARELLGGCKSCAVVPIGDPQALADGIDRCLARHASEDLRKIAEPYRIDAAIRAHVDALTSAVDAQNRTETPV